MRRPRHRPLARLVPRTPLALVVAVSVLPACRFNPHDTSPATPQRPGFSSGASTTAESSTEVEAGLYWNPHDEFSTPVVVKYGSGPSTEVFAGMSPFVFLERPGENGVGYGDLMLGIRHRLIEEGEHTPSFAVQSAVKIPSSDEDERLGSNELDASFAFIGTKSVDELNSSFTGFYRLDLLGDPSGGTTVGHVLAAAGTQELVPELSTFAELAGVLVPSFDLEQVFATLGVSHPLNPSFVVDLGIELGLTDDATGVRYYTGITKNLGRSERLSANRARP